MLASINVVCQWGRLPRGTGGSSRPKVLVRNEVEEATEQEEKEQQGRVLLGRPWHGFFVTMLLTLPGFSFFHLFILPPSLILHIL